ncbi:MAG: alkaline shock response membrane anchor protein AmaP [Clostridia bacterium]|nr:alkaline shock response membrane anchor protein AmaP [Clostridia bacterium]
MKKFRFWHRIIIIVGAVLVIALGLGVALPLLPFFPYKLVDLLAIKLVKYIYFGVAVLCTLIGLYLFTIPHKFTFRRKDFVIQQTENGELRIAVVAIKNLVQKCVDMHEEVQLSSMRIHNARGGITVGLNISLSNNIIIPLAVSSLQKQIKQYLLASSGIEVKEVKVAVETAKEAANNSPYLVNTESDAEQENAAQAKDKKQPIHQRLFKRDQEPATLPVASEVPAPAPAEAPAEEAAVQEVTTAAEAAPIREEAPVAEETIENAEQAQEEENNE